jgi:hypothetical protein
LGGKVFIWKQARELVIMREPKSTAPPPILPADKVTEGDIPQTSLLFRLSRMPHGRHIKEVRKKNRKFETSLLAAAVIKLGTRPSTPPRSMTYTTREPTPTHTTHITRNTRE